MNKKKLSTDRAYYIKQVDSILSKSKDRSLSVLTERDIQVPFKGDYDDDTLYYTHIDNLIRYLEIELESERQYIEEVKKLRSEKICCIRTNTLYDNMRVPYRSIKERIQLLKEHMIYDWNIPEKQVIRVDYNGVRYIDKSSLRDKVVVDFEDIFFDHFERSR